MLFTRSVVLPEIGSSGFGASDSGGGVANVICISGGDVSGMLVVSVTSGVASRSSSARRRQMLSVFANLRGPHLRSLAVMQDDTRHLVTYGCGITSTTEPSSFKILCWSREVEMASSADIYTTMIGVLRFGNTSSAALRWLSMSS